MNDLSSRPTQLYRHFDAAGDLLYVGVSLCALTRLTQHRQRSDWFSGIARIEIENFPDRASAERAELTAIQSEKPQHNRAGAEWRAIRWRTGALEGIPFAACVARLRGMAFPMYNDHLRWTTDDAAHSLDVSPLTIRLWMDAPQTPFPPARRGAGRGHMQPPKHEVTAIGVWGLAVLAPEELGDDYQGFLTW